MKPSDRNLGMDRSISRRDLLLGMGASAASAFVPGQAFADEMLKLEGSSGAYYPPKLLGMRGSHIGSFEVAHQLGREGKTEWGPTIEPDGIVYDLVVVGGGVSGLSAAYFYRKEKPDARILILDNHDDFGGHAKRNEFEVAGRTLMTHGGSEILEGPGNYNAIAKELFHELGIRPQRLADGYDPSFYKKHGLTGGVYFDKDTFGVDRTLAYPLVNSNHYDGWIAVDEPKLTHEEAVRQMPISDAAKDEMLRLLTTTVNAIPKHSYPSDDEYLNSISYREFLSNNLNIMEPEVYLALERLTTDWCVGIEAVPALEALYWGLPGMGATNHGNSTTWFGPNGETSPTYHFPDGNASVARMLVRSLVPRVATGKTIEDLVLATFKYQNLDREDSNVRVRLQSTVVNVKHDGNPESSSRVGITYVRGNQANRVRARHCILACYNQIIPHLCPELPRAQREALQTMVKSPILYANVALRNWRSWKNIGIGAVVNPGGYCVSTHLDYPVDFGGYEYPREPEDPAIVHMVRFPHMSNAGLTPVEQKRIGRHELYATTYETIERNLRQQLAGSLSEGGFDPALDIEGITVNRWPHAYINRANPLYDDVYEDWDDERYPFVRGRKPFGRIAIANSDSGSISLLDTAISQGYRAVTELL